LSTNHKQIAFATDSTKISGVDTVHFTLASGFKNLGINSHFLSFGKSLQRENQIPEYATRHHIKTPQIYHRLFYPRGRQWSVHSVKHYSKQANQYLQKAGPIWWAAGHLNYLWMAPPPPNCKQLGIVHAPDEQNLRLVEKYQHLWDSCIAVSQESADAAIKRVPQISPKLSVIPNGITIPKDPPRKRTQSNPLEIIWCGRIEQDQKRVFDLQKISNELVSNKVNFKLHIIGDGKHRKPLESALMPHILSGKVKMHGRLSLQQTKAFMQSSHLFLLPSAYEGTPMALLEAMAVGCVPVASHGCGGALPFLQKEFPDFLFL
jgi:glycosyltransferase involved in cell wall biosynthesis